MKLSPRGLLVIGAFAVVLVAIASLGVPWLSAAEPRAGSGQLTQESLGNLLAAMGLDAKKVEQRYDFMFEATHEDNKWELSMTAVLSKDGSSIWVMAWLDELPRSAADVPRTALLRLLANNDRLGSGKFFAYIASNRRFVLQRVIPNNGISTAMFRDVLQDLGASVVETYPHWSVANWSRSEGSEPAAGQPMAPNNNPPTQRRPATQSATSESKFAPPIRN